MFGSFQSLWLSDRTSGLKLYSVKQKIAASDKELIQGYCTKLWKIFPGFSRVQSEMTHNCLVLHSHTSLIKRTNERNSILNLMTNFKYNMCKLESKHTLIFITKIVLIHFSNS